MNCDQTECCADKLSRVVWWFRTLIRYHWPTAFAPHNGYQINMKLAFFDKRLTHRKPHTMCAVTIIFIAYFNERKMCDGLQPSSK